MGSRSNLPIDIVNCILSELPVKSLLRFKLTCKSWCCTINDPDFIKSHLHKSTVDTSRQKILFANAGGFINPECRGEVDQYKIRSTNASISSDSKVVCLPNIPGFDRDPYFELLSCSGLVFIMSCSGSMALWNPAVQKYKLIPDSLLSENKKPWTPWISCPIFGFAYDFAAEDYKVVRLHIKRDVEHPCYIVEIFSVKNQSWRTLDNILPITALGDRTEPVSLNGVIHKMGWYQGEEHFIISFHLADEKFILTPVPRTYGRNLALHAWGDRLSVLATVGKEISVWSLEKDSLTWNYITKFPTLRSLMEKPNDWESLDIIDIILWDLSLDIIVCVKENGNIIWRNNYNGRFIEYNVRKNKYVEYSLTGLPSDTWHKVLYVESLASLKIPWD